MSKELSENRKQQIIDRIRYDILEGYRKVSDPIEARIIIEANIEYEIAYETERLNNSLTEAIDKLLKMLKRHKITTALRKLELSMEVNN